MAQKGPERQRGPAVAPVAPAERRKRRGIVRFGKSRASALRAVARGDFSGWTDEKASAPRAVARPNCWCRCLLRRAYAPCAVGASCLRRKFPICRAPHVRRRPWNPCRTCSGSSAVRPARPLPWSVGACVFFSSVRPASIRRPARFAPGKSTLFPLKKELVVFWHGLDDMPRKLAFLRGVARAATARNTFRRRALARLRPPFGAAGRGEAHGMLLAY